MPSRTNVTALLRFAIVSSSPHQQAERKNRKKGKANKQTNKHEHFSSPHSRLRQQIYLHQIIPVIFVINLPNRLETEQKKRLRKKSVSRKTRGDDTEEKSLRFDVE